MGTFDPTCEWEIFLKVDIGKIKPAPGRIQFLICDIVMVGKSNEVDVIILTAQLDMFHKPKIIEELFK